MVSVTDVTTLHFPSVFSVTEVGLCGSICHIHSMDVVNAD